MQIDPGPFVAGFSEQIAGIAAGAFAIAMGVLVWHLRAKSKQQRLEMIHHERMVAMEKGIPLPELPEFPEVQTHRRKEREWGPVNPRWPLGVGMIFILVGLGVSLAYYLAGDAELARSVQVARVWPFGLIGVFAGVGFIFHYFITRGPQR